MDNAVLMQDANGVDELPHDGLLNLLLDHRLAVATRAKLVGPGTTGAHKAGQAVVVAALWNQQTLKGLLSVASGNGQTIKVRQRHITVGGVRFQ